MKDTIHSINVAKWYKSCGERIKTVNFESERGRFTKIISEPGKRTVKLNLVIKHLYGELSLEEFVRYGMNEIRAFFVKKYNTSKTGYLVQGCDTFKVIDKKKKII
jgi:hypothetical protein